MIRAMNKAWSKTNLTKISNNTIKSIVDRVRSGMGVKNKSETRLKPLSQSYIDQRRKSRKLDSTTSPSKSNLTFSGRMLRSITSKIGTFRMVLGFSNSENKAKAGYVSKDRPFFDLTKKEEEKLIEELKKPLLKEVKRLFK